MAMGEGDAEQVLIVELEHLVSADYAVAIRRLDSRTIITRAVKNGLVKEGRGKTVSEAVHDVYGTVRLKKQET